MIPAVGCVSWGVGTIFNVYEGLWETWVSFGLLGHASSW